MENDPRLSSGAELFNQQRFFEAHEIWEDCWREATGGRRSALQGLVQAAAAFHHLQKGNRDGALSLLEKACSRLREGDSQLLPWDLQIFERSLERFSADLRAKGPGKIEEFPRIYAARCFPQLLPFC